MRRGDVAAKIVEFQNVHVKMTDVLEQYFPAKRAHPNAILFFQMGDFYEIFFDDAVLIHNVLNLKLTKRGKDPYAYPMAGVPIRAAEEYITELVERGHTVAVCDQLEKAAKGKIVRRGITRVVTAGTLMNDKQVKGLQTHRFLASVGLFTKRGQVSDEIGLAFVDINTGAFSVTEVHSLPALRAELTRIDARELLVPEEHAAYVAPVLEHLDRLYVRQVADEHFVPARVLEQVYEGPRDIGDLEDHASYLATDTVEGFFKRTEQAGFRAAESAARAVAAIVWFVSETQRGVAKHIERLQTYQIDDFMVLDEATQANLELTETMRGGKRQGSLLSVIDETVSAAGARRLRTWLTYPLLDRRRIEARLDVVGELVERYAMREDLRACLNEAHDIERLSSRLATGRARPGDLVQLKLTLQLIPKLQGVMSEAKAMLTRRVCKDMDPCESLVDLIERAIEDDPSATVQDGKVIREGYSEELDRVLKIEREGKDMLLRFEDKERKATGIKSLKVKYSRHIGYHIEVTKAHRKAVPRERYMQRQTLTTCDRFTTPELMELEEEVLTAADRKQALEQELFEEVRNKATAEIGRLRQSASMMATLDVFAALAHIAHERDYCRPQMFDDRRLMIAQGRHPVVERSLESGVQFVPNDTHLNGSDARLHLLTGPNMAGKSTVIRQVALITLMAQVGSFVPAAKAEIGVVDRIFSRVGASDNLAKGQSTFMVEMTETAHILAHATDRSLIILDEIGRGTATFDGLSIAWSVAEYLHDTIKARVLFATHYHELTELEGRREGFVNYNIAVKEERKNIIFLHKVIPGSANHSYGIQVGRLAGLPTVVTQRAHELLEALETRAEQGGSRAMARSETPAQAPAQAPVAPTVEQATQLGPFGGGSAK